MLALAGLSACDKEGGGAAAPTGQVVATVDGEEITANELNQELAGVRMPQDAQAQKAIRNAALQTIINRHLVAKAARDQGLDKTPEVAVQRAKMEDMAVIGAFEKKLAGSVPEPTAEEAQRYVAEHPNSFSQRKLYVVDQIMVPGIPPELVKQLEPLKTLADVRALLQQNKIPHQNGVASIDGAGTDPDLVAKIAALPPGEVFVVRNGPGLAINQVRDSRTEPLAGPQSVQVATAILKRKRTQEIVGQQIRQVIQQGAGKVQYAEGYSAPPQPGAPGAGGRPAAGASPAAAGQPTPAKSPIATP